MSDTDLPTRAEILAAVADIARHELDHDGPVEPGQRLVEDLELDSIRLLTLATAVEDRFHILLDEEDETSIVTVEDLLDMIEAKLVDGKSEPGDDAGDSA